MSVSPAFAPVPSKPIVTFTSLASPSSSLLIKPSLLVSVVIVTLGPPFATGVILIVNVAVEPVLVV